jgi:radical SAM superfamily enzyme YgiQ (UPF0313 family)
MISSSEKDQSGAAFSGPIAGQHLVLSAIDESTRIVSIRALGGYTESIGVRTTLLTLIKQLARFGQPMLFSEKEIDVIASFLDREKATHLGFYLMTASYKPFLRIVKGLRQRGYKGCILAGGVHVTLRPEECMAEGVDYAVQGPGELPMRMLFENKPLESIPGLVWRKDQRVILNPVSPAQRLDRNTLPFPIFRWTQDKVLLNGKLKPFTFAVHRRFAEWHGRYYDLVTSRGCVNRCTYCCNVDGAPVNRSSVDRAIAEVRHLKDTVPEIRGINIQDDSFYIGSDEWCDEFTRRMKEEIGFPMIIRMIPRFVTKERMERFRDRGVEYVTMGLESSDRVNRDIFNRRETRESLLRAARIVLEANLVLTVDVIVDNPFETEADLRDVALTLNALPRGSWWTTQLSLTVFPGTQLYERCRREAVLERFATDPYDSMLIPSRPGGYRTPHFWALLDEVIPLISPALAARLITAGPDHSKAPQLLEKLAKRLSMLKRTTTFLRDRMGWVYKIVYYILRPFYRGRKMPAGMRLVD